MSKMVDPGGVLERSSGSPLGRMVSERVPETSWEQFWFHFEKVRVPFLEVWAGFLQDFGRRRSVQSVTDGAQSVSYASMEQLAEISISSFVHVPEIAVPKYEIQFHSLCVIVHLSLSTSKLT